MAFLKKTTSKKTEKKEVSAQGPASVGSAKMGVLLHAHITEKTAAAASRRMYAFLVAPSANKMQIKQAIQSRFGVTVTDVRVVNIAGKATHRGRQVGKSADIKKAYATIAEGQTIDIQ